MNTQLSVCHSNLQAANKEILQLHQRLGIFMRERDKLDKCIFENDLLSKGILEINQEREKCMERERDLLQQQAPLQEPTISPRGMPRETTIHRDDSNTPKEIPLGGGTKRQKKHYRKLTRKNIRKRKMQTRKRKTRKHKKRINTRKRKTRRFKS
jgi:hypothetical protein